MYIARLLFWRVLALTALILALAGVILPGLPTTPFLLLAAWGGARGWPALEQRLLAHPSAGPVIHGWRERRVVPRRAKWLASAMMALSLLVLVAGGAPPLLVAPLAVLMMLIAIWLWRCPDA